MLSHFVGNDSDRLTGAEICFTILGTPIDTGKVQESREVVMYICGEFTA